MSDDRVMRGMVLAEDTGNTIQLWAVTAVRTTKKGASATLVGYSGARGGNVWASSEARATFPDSEVRPPFHVVSALDVARGKFPERLKPELRLPPSEPDGEAA
jgi:hypothetical protein